MVMPVASSSDKVSPPGRTPTDGPALAGTPGHLGPTSGHLICDDGGTRRPGSLRIVRPADNARTCRIQRASGLAGFGYQRPGRSLASSAGTWSRAATCRLLRRDESAAGITKG